MTRRASVVPRVVIALVALSVVSGCGSSDESGGDAVPQSSAGSMPTVIPAAPGDVTTGYAVTVIQKRDQSVQLCLGFTTAVFPPDCGGPEVTGWDWSAWSRSDREYQVVGGTTFGQFAVTGTWDGSTLALTDAVPGRNSPDFADAPAPAGPRPDVEDGDLKEAARGANRLPGVSVVDVRGGRVHVDLAYDDGSLQEWCDQEYGDGVVVVTSELFDVE